MSSRHIDRWTGLAIAAAAALWCLGVVTTIPALDDGSRLGARGFPLGLGTLLGILGLIVFALSFRARQTGEEEDPDMEPAVPFRTELWAVSATVILMTAYGALLEYTGFLVATVVTTAVGIGPVLGIWRPRLIAALSLGMALGIYLILGKMMGVYLPYGRWINLSF